MLDEGLVDSGSDIAKREGLPPSTVNEAVRLTLLDPWPSRPLLPDGSHGV